MQVLKIGGNEIDEPNFLNELIETIKLINTPLVIVHGGGKEITELQELYDIKPRYLDGLRVTDEFTLELVKMVLCGAVNTRIVELLQLAGLEAQGLSGLDRGLLWAERLNHPRGDLGRVGDITKVRGEIILNLVEHKVIPVIAPISLSEDGALNVNADYAAGAVGAAIGADRVVFMTNIGGVLENDQVVPILTPSKAEALIASRDIRGGMIPKVQAALELLQRGVKEIRITDLKGLREDTGTTVISEG